MFVVVNEKDQFFGQKKSRPEADKLARELAEASKGVEFFVYEKVWMCCYPTDEQKADKEFWK